MRAQLDDLCAFLEEQMGLAKGWLAAVPFSAFLHLASTKRVQGCVVVEHTRLAYAVQPPALAADKPCPRSCGSAAGGGSDAHQAAGGGKERAARPHASAVCSSCVSERASQASDGEAPRAEAGPDGHAEPGGHADAQFAAGAGTVAAVAARRGAAPLVTVDRRQRVRASCGVRLIWVSIGARRQGLATRLLDWARARFMQGYVVPRHELAFTQPTEQGRAFIEAFTGTPRFLVYE